MPVGRPLKVINWEEVDKLIALQCTRDEIASFIGVDETTLKDAIRREHGLDFPSYFALKRGAGKASLRRRQFESALEGNATMLIWLGKQWLGQTDKIETKTELSAEIKSTEFEILPLK